MRTHPAYLRGHPIRRARVAFFHRPLVSAFAAARSPELALCLGSLLENRRLLFSLDAGRYSVVGAGQEWYHGTRAAVKGREETRSRRAHAVCPYDSGVSATERSYRAAVRCARAMSPRWAKPARS